MSASQKLSDEERLRKQNEIAEEATQIWEKASETGDSEYLRTKQVEAYGIRYGHDKHGTFIAVPLHDTSGKLWSLQKIYASNSNGSNNKWLLTGGRKSGCFHTIGSQLTQLDMNTTIYLCEGYATGASVHMATSATVIIAFDSGNIDSVMREITKTYPNLSIVITADNDCWNENEKNPGLEAANKASQKYGCFVVHPKFTQESHSKNPTDFNDLHVLDGIEEVCQQIQVSKVKNKPNPDLNTTAIGIIDFLNMEFPVREMILAPIIPEKGLVMLYAPRGIGKTWISAEIGYTVASGSQMFNGKWHCKTPNKVLFIDGEMPASVLQERLFSIALSRAKIGLACPENDFLKIISSDVCERGIPDLSTKKGQEFIESHLDGVKLLILDNMSSLCNSGRENENESWIPMQDWLLSLRRRGITVIFIHHAGKGGNQRGNSKKEDLLDTVIALRRPSDYEAEQGARFEVHYEKARGFYGEDAKPFEAKKITTGEQLFTWEIKGFEDSRDERIIQLSKEGLSQRDIANEVNVGVATVNRVIKKTESQKSVEYQITGTGSSVGPKP